MLDVSVIHPSADSYRNYALLPLGAAKHREAQKQSAYRDLAEAEDVEFHPFVVESSGAFGDSANQVLDILSSHASPADSLPVSIWKSLLARSIAEGQCPYSLTGIPTLKLSRPPPVGGQAENSVAG